MRDSILSRFDFSEERIDELREQLEQKREKLEQKGQQARSRTEEVLEDVQTRSNMIAGRLRDSSLSTGYEVGANTLSRAAQLLDDVPGVAKGAEGLRERARDLEEAGKAVERPPIDDYDELNVQQVNDALEELTPWQLEKVRRYEQANKDRVTILREVDRLLDA